MLLISKGRRRGLAGDMVFHGQHEEPKKILLRNGRFVMISILVYDFLCLLLTGMGSHVEEYQEIDLALE